MSQPLTADDIITRVTGAPAHADALLIIDAVRSRALLVAVADLLYIGQPENHSSRWLRAAIIAEARG